MEPIAKRLRQSAESAVLGAKKKKQVEEDVAERIKRLEAELQQQSDDDEDDSSSSDSDSDASSEQTKKTTVLNFSAYALERIEALPEQYLPPKKPTSLPVKAGRKRKADENEAASNTLLNLIEWPKKVPFACKMCQFIGKNFEEFQTHRQSVEHIAQERNGQPELNCKLCSKTFTSQSQLDEHKAGKWHQQRAKQKRERHVVKICYDFMRGTCFRGDKCAFDHTETKAMKSGKAFDQKKRRLCDNYSRTQSCKFGDKCLFSHEKA